MAHRTVKRKKPALQLEYRYNDEVVSRFINTMMQAGKKTLSTRIMYTAFDMIEKKTEGSPLDVFRKAMSNVMPQVEVKSRRVGGSTYQVPIEVRPARRQALAMRWLISAASARKGHSMAEKLSAELLDASNAVGAAYKRKEEIHRAAEANKAFAHYRW